MTQTSCTYLTDAYTIHYHPVLQHPQIRNPLARKECLLRSAKEYAEKPGPDLLSAIGCNEAQKCKGAPIQKAQTGGPRKLHVQCKWTPICGKLTAGWPPESRVGMVP